MIQTLENFQVLHTWIFFSVCHLDFFSGLWYKYSFFSRWRPRKKSRFAGPEFFLQFETDLDFQKSRCRLKGRKFNLKRLEPENKSLCFTHVHNSSSIRNYTGRSSQLTVINDLNLSFIKVCCQQQTGTSAYFSEKFYENDDGWIRNALIPSHYL